jgi:hypothetical protein
MKKQILLNLFLFTFLCAAPVVAQRLETQIKIYQPDYSGTWKLNPEKSRGLEKNDAKEPKLSHLWVIEQKLPAIGITVKMQRGTATDENFFGGKLTLWTDGRGDEYIEGVEAFPSVSGWKNNKLTVTHYSPGGSVGNITAPKQITSIEEYDLSAEGKTLTITVKQTSFRYIPDEKKQNFKEERYFDDAKTVILVFDKIR